MPPESFSIAQVTPYAWEEHHEVNRFVERLSDELCARGHRVVVIAPSESRQLVRESRSTIKKCREDPECVFANEGCAQVLAVGQSVLGRRGGSVSVPIDVSRTIESLLESAPFDFVHVHEPFAPSTSSAALRHSRALNVGTFHAATERVLSTQVARRFVELFFGRLDARTASFGTTRDLCRPPLPRRLRGDPARRRPGRAPAARPQRRDGRHLLLGRGGAHRAAGVPAGTAAAARASAVARDDLGAPAGRPPDDLAARARCATA